MNYEDDLSIDETALDVEWLEQPRLMMRYGQESARAKAKVTQIREKLEVVKAELDKDIRQDPVKYGIDKITEKAIDAVIRADEEYQEVIQSLLEAEYEVNVLTAAVYAMNARKEALENLVKLHGQQYFAGPRVPRDINVEAQKRRESKAVDAQIGSAFKRKRTNQ